MSAPVSLSGEFIAVVAWLGRAVATDCDGPAYELAQEAARRHPDLIPGWVLDGPFCIIDWPIYNAAGVLLAPEEDR